MTDLQWNYFCEFRNRFKSQIEKWNQAEAELKSLQKQAAEKAETPSYPFETAVVYNRALDEIQKTNEIKIIVIGDNPGKDEQLAKNNKYLVGQAGKLGERFFKNHPELQTDFRKNVIILNKTPVHSAKTGQLKTIMKNGGKKITDLIEETQLWMARETVLLAKNTGAKIWLVGYSELKSRGIFGLYRDEIKKLCETTCEEWQLWDNLFVFQHFSMNRFSIDLKEFMNNHPEQNLIQAITNLGRSHRDEIFGGN